MPNIRQWINKLYYAPKIPFEQTPLGFYVEKLENHIPFSFSRFGDGEWSSILGKSGANCDGHHYFPQLSNRLQDAVKTSYHYMYGIQNFAIKNMGKQIYRFLKQNHVNIVWHNSDVFHYANIAGELNPLIKVLRTHTVAMVGPEHLKPISNQLFKYDAFIEIPQRNCFTASDDITHAVRLYSKEKTGVVYAFSASMAANCIIHELFPELGGNNWLIDFGSLWDVYVGIQSRSVYKRQGWDEIIRKNLDK